MNFPPFPHESPVHQPEWGYNWLNLKSVAIWSLVVRKSREAQDFHQCNSKKHWINSLWTKLDNNKKVQGEEWIEAPYISLNNELNVYWHQIPSNKMCAFNNNWILSAKIDFALEKNKIVILFLFMFHTLWPTHTISFCFVLFFNQGFCCPIKG